MAFIERITLKTIDSCRADPEKIRIVGSLPRDITDLLPYLNAVIPNAVYTREAESLSYVKDGRTVTLYPDRVLATKVVNTTQAHQLLDDIRRLLNETHARREEVTPLYEARKRPSIIEVFHWLPEEYRNCGECAANTCMAFAARLWNGESHVDDCAPLRRGEFPEAREALETAFSANVELD